MSSDTIYPKSVKIIGWKQTDISTSSSESVSRFFIVIYIRLARCSWLSSTIYRYMKFKSKKKKSSYEQQQLLFAFWWNTREPEINKSICTQSLCVVAAAIMLKLIKIDFNIEAHKKIWKINRRNFKKYFSSNYFGCCLQNIQTEAEAEFNFFCQYKTQCSLLLCFIRSILLCANEDK